MSSSPTSDNGSLICPVEETRRARQTMALDDPVPGHWTGGQSGQFLEDSNPCGASVESCTLLLLHHKRMGYRIAGQIPPDLII